MKVTTIKSTLELAGNVHIPCVGLGVWKVTNEDQLNGAVQAALAAGYRHIDTAQAYENEDIVGRAVKKYANREELFITTKLSSPNQENPERAFEESLSKLGTDYVDLFLMHWPAPWRGKYIDVWKTMINIQKSGRAKVIGVSNFKPAHIERILEATGVVPVVNQVERHPLFQQVELARYCRAKGIAMQAYSPLCSGHLGEIAPSLEPIAKKYGKTPAQIVLRWHLQTGWLVVPKSATPVRIAENADIFDFELDDMDLAAIEKLNANQRYLPDSDEATF